MSPGGRASLMLILTAIACDRQEPAPPVPPTAPPLSPPTATQQVSQVEKPMPAIFVVSQPEVPDQRLEFPAARLVLQEKDGSVRASLFSIDPPEVARDPNSRSNSFYFVAALNVANVGEVDGAECLFTTSSAESDDVRTGLFLQGGRQTLTPMNVVLKIDTEDAQHVAYVSGTFKLTSASPDEPTATSVKARARLLPEVVIKR